MDQNQWFNTGSPAPMNDRQAFEAGWTAAQRQMAYSPQVPQINERIFQQTPQQAPPPRPTYLPGRVVNSPDDIRASEIPMDGTVAVFPSSDVTTETAGVAQLSFAIGGDILPESTMVRQIATANAFDSIALSDLISVNCCDFDRLTVTNTGAIPVVISTNPLLYVKRVS